MNKGDSDKAQGPEKQTGSKGEMAGVAVCSVNSESSSALSVI